MKLDSIKKKESKDWCQKYLIHLELQNKSPLTVLNYQSDILQFFKWLEKREKGHLLSVNAETINQYLAYLKKLQNIWPSKRSNMSKKIVLFFQNFFVKEAEKRKQLEINPEREMALSAGSLRRHISVLRNFFEFLKQSHEDLPGKEGDKFNKNPIKPKLHQIKLKDTDISHTFFLSPQDFEKLDYFAHRPLDRTLIYILYYGGLRLAEASRLSFEDFDLSEGRVDLIRKGGDRHLLYFHQFAPVKEELLRLKKDQNRDTGPLFISQKTKQGLTTRALAFRLQKLFLKAQLSEGIAPHSFRKARATQLYMETRDLLYVRDYLNHADAKVTQTYIDQKALGHNQREEYKRIEV